MAFELINIGRVPNDGTGDDLRTAFLKVNLFLRAYADLAEALGTTDVVAALNGLSSTIAGRQPATEVLSALSTLGSLTALAGAGNPVGDAIAARIADTEKGAANGVATLGSDGKLALAQRPAADIPNVKDFGAQLDGTKEDLSAFSAARAATPNNGTVEVPPGTWKVSGTPAGGPSTPILWRLSGNTTPEGWPVIGIGTDVVETMVEGGKYFAKANSRPNDGPVVRIDQTINHSGGTLANVIPAFRVNQTITNVGGLNNFGWANSTILTSSGRGAGEHVALASLATRPADALSDGQGQRSPIWGLYVETNDQTNQPPDATGSMVGFEHDMFANGEDHFTGANRINHHMVLGRQNPTGPKAYFGWGSVISNKDGGLGYAWPDQSYVGVGYGLQIAFNGAGFDASQGFSIAQAPAFRMAEGMSISFDAENRPMLRHDVGALRYYYNGTELFNIKDTGEFNIGGAIYLQESNPVVFTSDAKSQLKHTSGALRYYYNGAEIFNLGDAGGMSLAGSAAVSGVLTSVGLKHGKNFTIAGSFDLNTLTEAGFYDGAGMVNAPTADWYHIEVQTHSNSPLYCKQTITQLSAGRKTYQRTRDAGNWSAWEEIVRAGTDVTFGTVAATAANVSGLVQSLGTGSGFVLSDRAAGSTQWTIYQYGGPLRLFRSDSGDLFTFNTPYFAPGNDGGMALGQPTAKWSMVYAASGSINTSDARKKTGVAPLTEAELAWAQDLAREIGAFQFLSAVAEKGEDGARHHIGLTVQRAIELGQARGLDPFRYGFICYDKWDAEPEVSEPIIGEDGEPTGETRVLSPARPAGDCYGFRPDQLALFIARGQEARLAALEVRLG
ncbi:tail fiber domain-containing protein [Methylobacterium nodulans]|uniref:Peptidase S74 domain-containing protein n=1 Tax=Methylobacterium nodulans (strain LMG 21967 / CNCM I-2342 / ORS 2060) TaxID=460265 RepID=B8ICJ7_METNO|nr:tail fiber domain-containing protein [Methylobacterium nodulans]ACL57408.1 hypothetical protein Mnod_2438 [Methylobacterium nodulans ORS 2060]